MLLINAVVLFSLLYICESAYVDTLPKCSIQDNDCLRKLYQKMLEDGRTGVPELNVPALDPMYLKNVSVNILDTVILTVTDGIARGMSQCVFNKFSIDINNHKGSIDSSCDQLTAEAHFNVVGTSPLIQGIIGSTDVNGDGKATALLEKVHMAVDFQIYPRKINDEIYMYISDKDIKYNYDVQNVHFITENIKIGIIDISELVSIYVNANWKQVLQSFGSIFLDRSFEIFVSFIQKFADAVPARMYITEDLSSYIKN